MSVFEKSQPAGVLVWKDREKQQGLHTRIFQRPDPAEDGMFSSTNHHSAYQARCFPNHDPERRLLVSVVDFRGPSGLHLM
jgi:hypothetical protein